MTARRWRPTQGVLTFLRVQSSGWKVSFKTTNLSSWQRRHWVTHFDKESSSPPAGTVSSGHFNTVIWLHKGGVVEYMLEFSVSPHCRGYSRWLSAAKLFIIWRCDRTAAAAVLRHAISSRLLSGVYLYTVSVMMLNQIAMQSVSWKQDLACLGCSELSCMTPLLLWESVLFCFCWFAKYSKCCVASLLVHLGISLPLSKTKPTISLLISFCVS